MLKSKDAICICKALLIANDRGYKCDNCGREYQKTSNGKLIQTKRPIPKWVTKCAINESLQQFIRHRKPERFTARGLTYAKAIIKTHKRELENDGYTCISRHDCIDGKFICYIQ